MRSTQLSVIPSQDLSIVCGGESGLDGIAGQAANLGATTAAFNGLGYAARRGVAGASLALQGAKVLGGVGAVVQAGQYLVNEGCFSTRPISSIEPALDGKLVSPACNWLAAHGALGY